MKWFPSIDDAITSLRLHKHKLTRHMHVFSHTTAAERLALFQIAEMLPPEARALEIGSHIGSSALFLCAGLAHKAGHLVCVDTWMNDTMPDGEKDTFAEFLANTQIYAHMITAVRKFSKDLSPDDFGGLLDFVFIDGDHSEDAVRSDFRLMQHWVKPGGLMAFHDLNTTFSGVHKAVGEALSSGDWQLLRLTGSLGTIRKVAA